LCFATVSHYVARLALNLWSSSLCLPSYWDYRHDHHWQTSFLTTGLFSFFTNFLCALFVLSFSCKKSWYSFLHRNPSSDMWFEIIFHLFLIDCAFWRTKMLNFFSFIHIYIQCLGHFSPLPSTSSLIPLPPSIPHYQAETILPLKMLNFEEPQNTYFFLLLLLHLVSYLRTFYQVIHANFILCFYLEL
jgi:hypothetical protein